MPGGLKKKSLRTELDLTPGGKNQRAINDKPPEVVNQW